MPKDDDDLMSQAARAAKMAARMQRQQDSDSGVHVTKKRRDVPTPIPSKKEKNISEESGVSAGSSYTAPKDLVSEAVAHHAKSSEDKKKERVPITGPVREQVSVPRPKMPEQKKSVSKSAAEAAEAYDASISASGGIVETSVNMATEALASKTQPSGNKKSVRISSELVDIARVAFPNLTNPKAVEAYIAYYANRPDLVEEDVREMVEAKLRDGSDDASTAAAIRSLTRMISRLMTSVNVSSMASVSLLAHWYEDAMRNTGVPLDEWLDLSDTIFEVSAPLLSLSSEYGEALRRSHGKKPKGF